MAGDLVFTLFAALMRFDERDAGAKDGRKREEQTAGGRSPDITDDTGDEGGGTGKGKPALAAGADVGPASAPAGGGSRRRGRKRR